MDGTKLDISGKPAKDSSSATYKQIPEIDLEGEKIASETYCGLKITVILKLQKQLLHDLKV